jgi:hypothetical protein
VTTTGWVKLWRQLTENPIWTEKPKDWLWMWIGLLFTVNHESWELDGEVMPAGSGIIRLRKFANFCRVTVPQVRGFLDHTTRSKMTAQRTAQRTTVVTVLNWESYQATTEKNSTTRVRKTAQLGSPGEHNSGPLYRKKKKEVKKEEEDIITAVAVLVDDFDTFWKLYPRKVGKAQARERWDTAIKGGADPAVIIAAITAQLPELKQRERKYIKHPETWLNQRGWEDEVAPPLIATMTAAEELEQFMRDRWEKEGRL